MREETESPYHHRKLLGLLVERFSLEDLRTLCFDLSVDYDSLTGEGKAGKARELLLHLVRRGRTHELVEKGKQLRDDINWQVLELGWARAHLGDGRDSSSTRPRVINLRPLDVTYNFKDRESEVNLLLKYLSEDSVRLITIVGRGGMGKTALASRVLADLEQGVLSVPGQDKELAIDGILYLTARSTGLGLDRIYTDVGRMLGEPTASRLRARWENPDTPLVAKVEYLLDAMQGGLYLILLDNFEDYLAEDNTIAEEGLQTFFERCLIQPVGARLIVTSREQINVVGAGLQNVRYVPLLEGLPEEEAVSLMRDLDPQGVLSLRDAAEVGLSRAAQSTAGIPRAIEIVAGILHRDRTATLSRLLDNVALFGEQVVERLVGESYQRLGESERRVMEALAVYDRPVKEQAIVYLLSPWFPNMNLHGSLSDLASGYFVRVDRRTQEFGLHPLDRGYVRQQLSTSRQEGTYSQDSLELRAADYYASIRKPESQWTSIEDLAPQIAEFGHRVRAEDYEGAGQVLKSIDSCLWSWGCHTTRIELLSKIPEHAVDPHSLALNLVGIGGSHLMLGQLDQALEYYKDALALSRKSSDRPMEGICLSDLGNVYSALGQFRIAITLYENALAIDREVSNRKGEGIRLRSIGRAYWNLGYVDRAMKLLKQAVMIFRGVGDRVREGVCVGSLGDGYYVTGQLNLAQLLHEKALSIARESLDRRGEGLRLGCLGDVHYALGQVRQAIKCYEEAHTIACEISNPRDRCRLLGRLGNAYRALKQTDRAIKVYEDALAIHGEIGDQVGKSRQLLGLGRALQAAGRFPEAQHYCEQALMLEVPETYSLALLALGITLLRQYDAGARNAFVDAVLRCRAMLGKTTKLYAPRYALATALLGEVVCDPRWEEESERMNLLVPARDAYLRALDNCPAKGVVQDAIRDLELIRAADIEGLEPVFELLEQYV